MRTLVFCILEYTSNMLFWHFGPLQIQSESTNSLNRNSAPSELSHAPAEKITAEEALYVGRKNVPVMEYSKSKALDDLAEGAAVGDADDGGDSAGGEHKGWYIHLLESLARRSLLQLEPVLHIYAYIILCQGCP